jgi:hypothetical protein
MVLIVNKGGKLMLYTRETLHRKLCDTSLFNPVEVENIMSAVGTYSMGCCVVACELLGIELTGNDIDVMFYTEEEGVENKEVTL